ncbi:hypothetical protein INT47_010697 [Mucor saturninus]|uniref:Uncharacterized protein n=1 Tax=Mucor saturninus TaxID=64648 RepID=A0A8H7UT72_9FUNG|nr:hypothetical protein INT47_010697 [Mucor saturninus]
MDDFNDNDFYDYLKRLRQLSSQPSSDEDVVMREAIDKIQAAEDAVSNETPVSQVKDLFDGRASSEYPVDLYRGISDGPEVIIISSDSEQSDDDNNDDAQFLHDLISAQERINQTKIQTTEYYTPLTNEKADCQVEMAGTVNKFQLAQDGKDGLCLGLRNVLVYDYERVNFISWLSTGRIPQHDRPPTMTYDIIVEKMRAKRRFMEVRLVRSDCNGQSLATTKELTIMCYQNRFRCAVTNCEIAFPRFNAHRYPYWSLTVDHRVPLYYSKYDPEAWGIDNLQLMSTVMNTIKSNLPDPEIYRWFKTFYDTNCTDK